MNRSMIALATIVTVATAGCLAVGLVVEQAFTKTEPERVASAKQNAVSRIVVLRGRITLSQPGNNVFVLSDDTGSAELYTCPRWYKKIDLRSGEMVTVTGHIMSQRAHDPKSLYVLAVHSISRDNGTPVTIRTTMGKPPWASSVTIRAQR